MNLQIRPIRSADIEAVVQLSLTAWAPVFASFEHVLGSEIYILQYPDWKTSQRAAVETVCQAAGKYNVWVAEVNMLVVGFVAYELNHEEHIGEVYMLAVDPAYQNRGIGTVLNNLALQKLKESGMHLAVVGTGGDPGHAPARAAYEKVGYTALPLVRYYKKL